MLVCCNSSFRPEDSWRLANKTENGNFYHKRRIEVGICPKCHKFILALIETNLKTDFIKTTIFKERKAYKAFEDYQTEKLNIEYKPKYGSKSNMSLHYFENVEVREHTGNVTKIRHYEVDFNGSRKLKAEVEVNYKDKVYYPSITQQIL